MTQKNILYPKKYDINSNKYVIIILKTYIYIYMFLIIIIGRSLIDAFLNHDNDKNI